MNYPTSSDNWFETWFASPYYAMLYVHRDDKEAELFIDNILKYLPLNNQAKILDIACGEGRHAAYIASKGYDVQGIDLSERSISIAKAKEHQHLKFSVEDMRTVVKANHFDVVFNCFTSFGYFDTQSENQLVANAFAAQLKEGAYLIFDFLNVHKTIKNLVEQESKTIDNITFQITRKIDQGFIIKTIEVEDPQQGRLVFQEKVAALNKELIAQFFINAGLKLEAVFGNYELAEFIEEESDRLIYIFKK
jgi:SAM-dependent methyltransferase